MIDLDDGIRRWDHPEILKRLLFPRHEEAADTPDAATHFVRVAEGVSVGCRFYRASSSGPNLLFFHGNGETAPEYDWIAAHYQKLGLNLFVAEYRGYGMSNGEPSSSTLIADAHPTFESFAALVRKSGLTGPLFVMGRSLGSAPAIEVAYRFQDRLRGLIVESGFASAARQLARIGVAHLFPASEDPVGFGNDYKIRSIRIPTLIIHGERDRIIPADEGRDLYSLSGAQHKSALFVPGAGHNNLLDRALKPYMEALEQFMRRA